MATGKRFGRAFLVNPDRTAEIGRSRDGVGPGADRL